MLHLKDTFTSLESRFPEPLALIITKSNNEQVNFCPVGYFSLVSYKPLIWAVAVYKKHFTNKVIKETKDFVLCLPSVEQTKDVLYSGSVHGYIEDKSKKVSFKQITIAESRIPLIDESIACFICNVMKEIEVGDHTLFCGEIKYSYISDKKWSDKIYNLDNKKLGNIKYGNTFEIIDYSPEDT
ncbi:MAG: hypothetical protein ACD_24C00392G0001 [uncultured bacterium]|nr:MAG: hypothetical protein ACD_24C00392G0001 [uncultured bacterium]